MVTFIEKKWIKEEKLQLTFLKKKNSLNKKVIKDIHIIKKRNKNDLIKKFKQRFKINFFTKRIFKIIFLVKSLGISILRKPIKQQNKKYT